MHTLAINASNYTSQSVDPPLSYLDLGQFPLHAGQALRIRAESSTQIILESSYLIFQIISFDMFLRYWTVSFYGRYYQLSFPLIFIFLQLHIIERTPPSHSRFIPAQ